MSQTNLPKLAELIPPDMIKAMIEAETEPLKVRRDELVDMCKRFTEKFPAIEDDEADAKAAEVLAVCQRFTSKSGRVETARVALKAPVLAADTAIGSLQKGPFAALVVAVETAASAIVRASTNFKVAKETKRREEAAAEARRQADAAALAERLASRGSGTVTMEDAATAQASADAAQKTANARPAELTRTHGDQAGVTSLKWKRTYVIESPAMVPRTLCVPSDALIRACLATNEASSHVQNEGWIELPDGKWGRRDIVLGCLVIDEPDLNVRR